MNHVKLWITLLIAAGLYSSCSKNGYSNTPSLALNTVNSTAIPYNTTASLLVFTFTLTEKSYNANDTLFVFETVPNCVADSADYAFQMTSLAQGVPSTTNGNGFKATMTASFSNGLTLEESGGYPDIEATSPCFQAGVPESDTAYFAFVLGSYPNYSDTVRSGPIVLLNE